MPSDPEMGVICPCEFLLPATIKMRGTFIDMVALFCGMESLQQSTGQSVDSTLLIVPQL